MHRTLTSTNRRHGPSQRRSFSGLSNPRLMRGSCAAMAEGHRKTRTFVDGTVVLARAIITTSSGRGFARHNWCSTTRCFLLGSMTSILPGEMQEVSGYLFSLPSDEVPTCGKRDFSLVQDCLPNDVYRAPPSSRPRRETERRRPHVQASSTEPSGGSCKVPVEVAMVDVK